ncbi:hypothetical protein ACJ41O_001879 [Fusarium nematophilum]
MDGSIATTPGQKAALGILLSLIILRSVRVVGNTIGYILYRPAAPVNPLPEEGPHASSRDCSVILPVTHPDDRDLEQCVRAILRNDPRRLHIVTVGSRSRDSLDQRLAHLRYEFPGTRIYIGAVNHPNKRRQIAHGIDAAAGSRVIVLVDDRVHWPTSFLESALAPFEDGLVAGVTVRRTVRRPSEDSRWGSFWRTLADFYYALLDHENLCVNAIDNSAILCGSTTLFRGHVLDRSFLDSLENERCFFGRYGPLKGDEYHFFTRYLLENDWRLKVQSTAEACVEVDVASFGDFFDECQRLIRSRLRTSVSMLCAIKDEGWRSLWAIYATWLTELFSFRLFYDAALFVTFIFLKPFSEDRVSILLVLAFILATKYFSGIPVALRVANQGASFGTWGLCFPLLIPIGYVHTLLKVKVFASYWKSSRAECKSTDEEKAQSRKRTRYGDQIDEPGWISGDVMQMLRSG